MKLIDIIRVIVQGKLVADVQKALADAKAHQDVGQLILDIEAILADLGVA